MPSPQSVRILHASNSVMQSAPNLKDKWYIEYVLTSARKPEGLMGWVSSEDTMNQVRMPFDTMEDAVSFAEDKGWEYTVIMPHKKKLRPFNYGDNFRYNPPKEA